MPIQVGEKKREQALFTKEKIKANKAAVRADIQLLKVASPKQQAEILARMLDLQLEMLAFIDLSR